MGRYQNYNTEKKEYETKYSKCNGSCQANGNKISCGFGCRNNINLDTCTNEDFFSDKNFGDYNSKYKNTDEYFLNRVEEILKNSY